jgi:hypothetical protein
MLDMSFYFLSDNHLVHPSLKTVDRLNSKAPQLLTAWTATGCREAKAPGRLQAMLFEIEHWRSAAEYGRALLAKAPCREGQAFWIDRHAAGISLSGRDPHPLWS